MGMISKRVSEFQLNEICVTEAWFTATWWDERLLLSAKIFFSVWMPSIGDMSCTLLSRTSSSTRGRAEIAVGKLVSWFPANLKIANLKRKSTQKKERQKRKKKKLMVEKKKKLMVEKKKKERKKRRKK